MKEKLHFSANLKSFLSEFPFLSSGDSVTFDPKKVKPKGNRYFIRKEVSLTPDDWVIFGVASTDDVDLVDDVIDAEAVFGAHLEEFVNTGRIFWEHGYKMAGKSDPETMIDIPLGIPYLAEIHDNKLWIYILLDKTHPQSKKVWKKINGADDRFRGQLGLSIGALPQGKPTTVKHPTKGLIKKSPPMKLYEVSITGQPINPFTWAQVVKSFINHQDESDKINKSTVKAASMFDAAKMEESMAQPMNNMQDPMAADPMAAMGGGGDPMAAMGGDPMAGMAGGDPMAAMGGDPMAAGAEDPMAAGAEGEEGSESLADLFGDEDAELGDGETGDSAINLLMDKIDMALEQISELKQSIDSPGKSLNRDDVDLPEAPEGMEGEEDEEEENPAPQLEEEPMTDIKKSVQESLDKQDMLLGLVKSLTAMMQEQKRVNKSLSDQLFNISEELEVFKTVAAEAKKAKKVETVEDRRKDFNPATTKSFASNMGAQHPGFSQVESDMSTDDKLKAILRDNNKTEILAELIGVYKSFSGQPNQVARKHEEIFGAAKDHLGLSKGAFKEIVNKVD